MIDFIELNESQKNYVVYLLTFHGHTKDTINLAEMKSYHNTMLAARASGCPKFGYPNWLIKPDNKVSKSVYHFPVPTGEELQDFYMGNVEPKINLDKYSEMFRDVVERYNLL